MIVAMLFASNVQAELLMGKDYKMLNTPQPASTHKIEVLEFFFYECGHCFHLHPLLAAWEKSKAADVEMTYVPTIFRDSTEPLAHAYYALQDMGQIQQLDDAIYQAIHVTQSNLYDADTIGAFVSKHGVDRAKFEAAYNSFSVQSKVTHAKQMIRIYNIQGTPTLIVDGRYVITGLQPEDSIRVLNEVIAKVRKERTPAKKH